MLDIRLATMDDAKELLEILSRAAQYKMMHNDDAWAKIPFTIERVQKIITQADMYIARLDSTVVGTLRFSLQDEEVWGEQPQDAAYVHQLAIKDGFHGHNLGEQLLNWAAKKPVVTIGGFFVLMSRLQIQNSELTMKNLVLSGLKIRKSNFALSRILRRCIRRSFNIVRLLARFNYWCHERHGCKSKVSIWLFECRDN